MPLKRKMGLRQGAPLQLWSHPSKWTARNTAECIKYYCSQDVCSFVIAQGNWIPNHREEERFCNVFKTRLSSGHGSLIQWEVPWDQMPYLINRSWSDTKGGQSDVLLVLVMKDDNWHFRWNCRPLPCCQLLFLRMRQRAASPPQLPSFPFQIRRRKMCRYYLFVCLFHVQFPKIYSVFWLISQDALLKQRKFSSLPISTVLKWLLTTCNQMNSPSSSRVYLHSFISPFFLCTEHLPPARYRS